MQFTNSALRFLDGTDSRMQVRDVLPSSRY